MEKIILTILADDTKLVAYKEDKIVDVAMNGDSDDSWHICTIPTVLFNELYKSGKILELAQKLRSSFDAIISLETD